MTRKRIFQIIERAEAHDETSAIFDIFIIILICLNTVLIIAESFQAIAVKYVFVLKTIEYFSVAIFTIEYLLRLWTADYKFPESKWPPCKIFLFIFGNI
jgi:voltage-gated potassium channel